MGIAYTCVLVNALPRAQEAESCKHSDGQDDPTCGCPFFHLASSVVLSGAMYEVVMGVGMEATYRLINLVSSSLRLFWLYSHS